MKHEQHSGPKRKPGLHQPVFKVTAIILGLSGFLGGCIGGGPGPGGAGAGGNQRGFEVKLLFGSALGDFCEQAAAQFNGQNPTLESGEAFHITCEAAGSGDVVTRVVSLAEQLQAGTIQPDSPEFPTLLSVDGEIYHGQLIYRVDQIFPGQDYIPQITDAPLLATSPMVFMTSEELAPGLQQTEDLYATLVEADTHQDIDPNSPPIDIHYVHTAPTRSNSGLQTLVSQYASVSGKRPEEMTVADVEQFTPQVQQIQQKITRYGTSTSSLARSMVQNGIFWASVGSVYESSVIAANANLQPGQPPYVAVYPRSTYTSNMRAILPNAPWVSDQEREAAEMVIEYLRSPAAQQLAIESGLRPGTPGVALGPMFSPEFGVNPEASYDSYRIPDPEVVEAMIQAWENVAKKPSLVVIVVDSSGSMEGPKLPAVQSTLQTYIDNLRPQDRIALIDFDSEIREPIVIEGTPEGKAQGLAFISSLDAEGGTRLYDSALFARDWLRQNLREDAINAVLVLTDGVDSESEINLNQLSQELQQSGFGSDERIGFFTIGYGQEGEFDPAALEQIAELNGGYYSKGDPETIGRVMDRLQLEF
jgi:Ca-activated chloride channel family protein